MVQKLAFARERILSAPVELLSSKFVDTTNAVVLTEEASMNAMPAK